MRSIWKLCWLVASKWRGFCSEVFSWKDGNIPGVGTLYLVHTQPPVTSLKCKFHCSCLCPPSSVNISMAMQFSATSWLDFSKEALAETCIWNESCIATPWKNTWWLMKCVLLLWEIATGVEQILQHSTDPKKRSPEDVWALFLRMRI